MTGVQTCALPILNPESRRLIKVMPTDVERTAQVFDILLGDNLAGRKEHIAQHGRSIWMIWMCLKEDRKWQRNQAKRP